MSLSSENLVSKFAFKCNLYRYIEGLLSRSKKPLSFAVVVPHWPEKPAWLKLANSAYAKRAVKLEAGKHGFVAGVGLYKLKSVDP